MTLSIEGRARWPALILLCLGELMIVLDTTIVNVALPSIKADLGFTETSLVWVVNAYMLTFGGCLLLGGRLGDLYGHRRLFLAGITLFTLASLACGLANTQGLLVAARAVQGVGGAVVSAVALSLIMNLFTEPGERARAMGGSRMFLELGSEVSVEDLIKGIIILSGNDACVVIAEGLSGSEESFADRMTKRAKELGMNKTVFKNASGWPAEGQFTTARDLAVLAWRTIDGVALDADAISDRFLGRSLSSMTALIRQLQPAWLQIQQLELPLPAHALRNTLLAPPGTGLLEKHSLQAFEDALLL